MSRISITERSRPADGAFEVVVGFEGGGEFAASVTDPFADDKEAEALLGWYFERHLRYPFLDKDREAAAVARIADYGAVLFAQVFAHSDCAYEYRRRRDGGFDRCRIEVVGSMAMQRLHWEALRDPKLNAPLAVRVPLVRRVETTAAGFDPPEDHPTLNILVVTARPGGAADVGYRTISRPLLGAVRQARLPVVVDFVRPGTWKALTAHLEATTAERGTGWYQVVHFDLHGAVAGASALVAAGYLFADDDPASDGADAYLFFETEKDGKSLPVATAKVADLLVEHRVPVAVLNACQSAKPPAQSEASLAQRLVEAGVPVSLGMAYSVTVSAAALMMPVLYQHLAEGDDLLGAAHAARRRLFADRSRQAYFDQSLDLEDWMLPVVYRQRPLEVKLRPFSPAEEAAFYANKAAFVDEPHPTYGFVGRDLDVQAIERRVLAENNQLLLSGMAGAGKSTLLAHLAWWWQVTGLVDRVFHFSYEDRAWTVDHIVAAVAKALLDSVGQARFSALPEDAQRERAAELLRAGRHLLVLDNAESITATPAAIPHPLPEAEQARLQRLLARLRGGRTIVTIGSRGPEDWLSAHSFGTNVYELGGLDPQAASVLVERVRTRYPAAPRIEDDKERGALEDLINLLGGYPLPLTVVLPTLATTPASEVLRALRQGTEEADREGLVRRAIEFSHGRLDPATRNSLLVLAPFTGVVPLLALDRYTELLAGHHAVAALGPLDLRGAITEAARVGLVTVGGPNHARVQPVLPYFLRNRLHSEPDLAVAVTKAHHDLYQGLAPQLHQLQEGQEPKERALGQALTRAEYANLTTALAHALATGQPVMPLVRPLEEYLDHARQQHARRLLIESLITALGDASVKERRAELAQLHELAGISAREDRRLADARRHHESSLDLFAQLEDRLSQGGARHNLGFVAQDQRRLEEAEQHYRLALEINLQFGDRLGAAVTYHQLGILAEELRRFDEAEAHYREALEIKLQFGDRHGAASTYHQLGNAAEKQRRFEEAEGHYREALAIDIEFGDRHGAANTYHQLGNVAEKQRRFEEAEGHYREALAIDLEFGDRHGMAGTYAQLGSIALAQDRLEESTDHYAKGLETFLDLGDRHSAAGMYHQLGIVAQKRHRLEEAEENYRKALAILLEFDDRHTAARTYQQLGTLAHEQRRYEAAKGHYRTALEIKLGIGDRYGAAAAYHQLGILAQDEQKVEEADGHYREAIGIYLESGDCEDVARSSSQLGILLTEADNPREGMRFSLDALLAYVEVLGHWSGRDLAWLKRQRRLVGEVNRPGFDGGSLGWVSHAASG